MESAESSALHKFLFLYSFRSYVWRRGRRAIESSSKCFLLKKKCHLWWLYRTVVRFPSIGITRTKALWGRNGWCGEYISSKIRHFFVFSYGREQKNTALLNGLSLAAEIASMASAVSFEGVMIIELVQWLFALIMSIMRAFNSQEKFLESQVDNFLKIFASPL